jgi:hypothetical protein
LRDQGINEVQRSGGRRQLTGVDVAVDPIGRFVSRRSGLGRINLDESYPTNDDRWMMV